MRCADERLRLINPAWQRRGFVVARHKPACAVTPGPKVNTVTGQAAVCNVENEGNAAVKKLVLHTAFLNGPGSIPGNWKRRKMSVALG